MDHSPTPPAIIVRNLTFRYYRFGDPVLADFSADIPPGCCAAILGASGAGKTTLLQVLSGICASAFTTATATGRIEIGTETFDPLPPRVLFPTVGYFMQDPLVQLSGIHDTVEEEIAFTLDNLGVPREEQAKKVSAILARMNLQDLKHRKPIQLSGGELQRVLLASLLVARPSVLLLDEPANSLDPGSQQRLGAVLRIFKSTATILFTDYQIEFALSVADLFLVIDRGKLLFAGDRKTFLEHLPAFQEILPVASWMEMIPSLTGTGSHERIIDARPFRILRKR